MQQKRRLYQTRGGADPRGSSLHTLCTLAIYRNTRVITCLYPVSRFCPSANVQSCNCSLLVVNALPQLRLRSLSKQVVSESQTCPEHLVGKDILKTPTWQTHTLTHTHTQSKKAIKHKWADEASALSSCKEPRRRGSSAVVPTWGAQSIAGRHAGWRHI